MIKSCYIDGCPFERDAFPEGLYVYQPIVTLAHRALHLGAYIELLNGASIELLNRPFPLSEREVGALIEEFLRSHRYPQAMPASVELRSYLSGEIVLLGGEVSPYPSWGLRLLMPSGVAVEYEVPLSECHSSVRRSAAEAANAIAQSRGARVAVQVTSKGEVVAVDNAELFVAKEYKVVIPKRPTSVEGELVVDAVVRSGLQLEVAALSLEELREADEIFYADHRGVTALGSFEGHPLMHILAEKIVSYL